VNHPSSDLTLSVLRRQSHPDCYVCDPANGHGLGLEFRAAEDGAVEATFPCQPAFASYPGMLHGGMICMLLDGAMTNCLFAHGLIAVTVDMNVRFRQPVAVSRPAVVRAWLESKNSPVYQVAAELSQGGHVAATATARFIEKQAMSWFRKRTP
jgi:uncharacterized protein (TIGR00369 family)